MMTIEEKLLALELILKDIRGNWGDDLEERVDTAEKLVLDLLMNDKYNKDMECMLESIREFKKDIDSCWCDGRHFRKDYPYGYNSMTCLHGLENTYNDKSEEFKKIVECLIYPEYAFSDWK